MSVAGSGWFSVPTSELKQGDIFRCDSGVRVFGVSEGVHIPSGVSSVLRYCGAPKDLSLFVWDLECRLGMSRAVFLDVGDGAVWGDLTGVYGGLERFHVLNGHTVQIGFSFLNQLRVLLRVVDKGVLLNAFKCLLPNLVSMDFESMDCMVRRGDGLVIRLGFFDICSGGYADIFSKALKLLGLGFHGEVERVVFLPLYGDWGGKVLGGISGFFCVLFPSVKFVFGTWLNDSVSAV